MVDFFSFSQKKVENTKIYAKIYNLLATGRKASGQCLFQGWSCGTGLMAELVYGGGLQSIITDQPSPPPRFRGIAEFCAVQ